MESECTWCKYCKKPKQFVNVHDTSTHADGQVHKAKKAAAVKEIADKARRYARLGVTALSATELRPHEVAARARAAGHARLIALGCNPTLASSIFNSGAIEMLSFARKFSRGVGVADAARTDAILAAEVGKERIKAIFKGRDDLFFSLINDGATGKLMGGVHVNAILIRCAELPKPVLLKLDIAADGSGKAEHIAASIMKVCQEYGLDLQKLCVGLMADNASVNQKVAKLFGFKRQLRCIAHTVALLILAAIDALPGVKGFLLALHAIFTAGGNTSRRTEAGEAVYVDMGMNVRAILQFYLNRWGTASKLIGALTEQGGRMLGALRHFFAEAKSIAAFKVAIARESKAPEASASVAAPESEDDGDVGGDELFPEDLDVDDEAAYLKVGSGDAAESADDDVGTSLFDDGSSSAAASSAAESAVSSAAAAASAASSDMAKASQKAARVRKAAVGSAAMRLVDDALKDPSMYAKLVLADSLLDQLSFLIEEASRDDARFSASLVQDLMHFGEGLKAADDGGAFFLDGALARLPGISDELKAALAGYCATAVHQIKEKWRHVDAWSDVLSKTLLWDHRVRDGKEEKLKAGSMVVDKDGNKVKDQRISAAYFGMVKMPSLAFLGQFNAWAEAPRTEAELLMEPAEYWRTKQTVYPLLYKLGLWYASVPLSSVAAERAIALMRDIETYKRNRMKEPQWQAENFIRYNTWVMDIDFDAVMKDVMKLQAAVDSPAAAAAVAAASAAADAGLYAAPL